MRGKRWQMQMQTKVHICVRYFIVGYTVQHRKIVAMTQFIWFSPAQNWILFSFLFLFFYHIGVKIVLFTSEHGQLSVYSKHEGLNTQLYLTLTFLCAGLTCQFRGLLVPVSISGRETITKPTKHKITHSTHTRLETHTHTHTHTQNKMERGEGGTKLSVRVWIIVFKQQLQKSHQLKSWLRSWRRQAAN